MKKFFAFFLFIVLLLLNCNTSLTVLYSDNVSYITPPFMDIIGQTYINKTGIPVNIKAEQIPIGKAWNFTYTLYNDKIYHAYFVYSLVSATTDYDIYMFDPNGTLVGWHTEASGLPEHLGDDVNYPFLTPKYSGNYTFTVKNDYPESKGAEPATLMVIEHIDTDKWYNIFMEGKDQNNAPVFNTSRVFEFNTSNPEGKIEFLVNVPDNLDMYEVRLLLMAYPNVGYGKYFANAPIAWEPGLYGNLNLKNVNLTSYEASNLIESHPDGIGGYNMDEIQRLKGYHGNSFSSCEYPGQDMSFNFTVPYSGDLLYHLVFIAEHGNGTLSFMIRTDFTYPTIDSVSRSIEKPSPNQAVEVESSVTDNLGIDQVLLSYFDGISWLNTTMTQMAGVYVATIPALPLSTYVWYRVYAVDKAGHWVESAIESYKVYSSIVIDRKFVSDERCDLGSLQAVSLHATWEYNNTDIVGGRIFINGTKYVTNGTGWVTFNTSNDAVGKLAWTVTEISCSGMTDYAMNVVDPSIIWDRIKIALGNVSSRRVEISQKATIWFTAVYEYDNATFDGSKGMLYVDDSAMSWSPVDNRWEMVYTLTTGGTKSFTVSKVSDNQYGIRAFIDMAGSQFVEGFAPPWEPSAPWWLWMSVGGVASLVIFYIVGTLYYRQQYRQKKR